MACGQVLSSYYARTSECTRLKLQINAKLAQTRKGPISRSLLPAEPRTLHQMAIEPLKTDEPFVGNESKPPDIDAQMLTGCSGFLISSVVGYLLAVWPFIVIPEIQTLNKLFLAGLLGGIPNGILGLYISRTRGLAGACGFVAGAMAMGVFLYLRIQQIFLAYHARQAPPPEYPEMFSWLIPLTWIMVCLLLAVLILPPKELE